jgi:hypothetical protein
MGPDGSEPEVASTPPGGWDIRREGRAWNRDEWRSRREVCPEKIEMIQLKLFWSDEERIAMLGLLLENLGVDRAVRLGDPKVWRDAIAALDNSSRIPGID